jgi:nucleoside-diphosphate-sugar epimerase
MSSPSVLFIGGTGRISAACVREAVARGFDVTVLNRGQTRLRSIPEQVHRITADTQDAAALRAAVGDRDFDVVAQFTAREPEQAATDIDVLAGRIGQYIFISSASAYQKPVARLPITESTPLVNPFWEYSRKKIASEDLLTTAYRDRGFPATVIRPTHTYDETGHPFDGAWTVFERLRQGKPVVVHGDGTSLWVMTYAEDFARAFTAVLANPLTIGDAFHITSDEVLTWNQIYEIAADAAGAKPRLVHVASETIAKTIPDLGPRLLGDKAYSVIFDNSKIKAVAPGWTATTPFARGAAEIVRWHDADPARKQVDAKLDAAMDRIVGSLQ